MSQRLSHSIIVRAVTALRVLYVLACGSSAALDLCHGLDEQAAVVVGARGMFAVGVGRLAFADPPEWLPKDEARALESVSGAVAQRVPCWRSFGRADAAQAILEKELTPEELEAVRGRFLSSVRKVSLMRARAHRCTSSGKRRPTARRRKTTRTRRPWWSTTSEPLYTIARHCITLRTHFLRRTEGGRGTDERM
jgi:hypothetical protein